MQQLNRRLAYFIAQVQQKIWQRLPKFIKGILILILLCLLVRSLPYLAPIRAVDLVQDDRAVEFLDRRGLPLGTLLTRDREHTVAVNLKRVSPHFIRAILAAEDGRFYQHGALDLQAIVRAIATSVQAGKIVSGASTITMQLARAIDPSLPFDWWGKVREVWLSWRLVAGMSKDEILEAYINRLPMGGNIYGIEAAARIYFDMPASELNVARASLLAALPNDPTFLNPYENWLPLKDRQEYVLKRMVEDGYITHDEGDRALTEQVILQSRQQGIIAAPHFLFWLADRLPKDRPAQIATTIDRPLQQFVEEQAREVIRSLNSHNAHHAAALVLDNRTGEVLAYVGSPDYFSDTELGRNDGVQALRQPGSTLKPFLYQLALEKRAILPNTVLADIPTYYAIPGAKLYNPIDYTETFQGPVRIRIALANSLNVPAVRVLEQIGVPSFLERLHLLGFEHLTHPADYYGLGLTLGSGEVSLWELARAYLAIAHRGKSIQLSVASDRLSEQISLPNSPTLSLPNSQTTWALIADMLSDRHARAKAFGVESVLALPFPTAVKTGTSSNFRDTWTVGFTTDYTVATWVGNFDGTPMQRVSGVTGAAPLWNRIMLHLHEHREPAPFVPPDGLVQRPVCALSGMKPTPACPSVVLEYFYPEDLDDYDRHPDTFYQAIGGSPNRYRLNLPAEYNEWLAMRSPVAVDAVNVESTGKSSLRILSPRPDDYFLLDPKAGVSEKLEFKLAGIPAQPVEWWLNDRKLATQASASLFWPLQPGKWTLQVKSGEVRDRVSFEVQLVATRTHRRGFSVIDR